MKYTLKYFKDNMPEWKRKKDPILSRIFYRPISFVIASLCAECRINANAVSYFSAIIAIISCICFFIPIYYINIVGAILVNIWLILDCVDGNLARSIKKQAFGEFADGISSYILVGLLCTSIGVSTYFNGGILIEKGCIWIVLLGALASSSDSLMRLIYQKYKNTERDMADKKIIEMENDKRTDHSQVRSLRVRIESELGIGGILPIAILIATIFNCLDIVTMYCFFYYGFSCIIVSLQYIRKAIKKSKIEIKEME